MAAVEHTVPFAQLVIIPIKKADFCLTVYCNAAIFVVLKYNTDTPIDCVVCKQILTPFIHLNFADCPLILWGNPLFDDKVVDSTFHDFNLLLLFQHIPHLIHRYRAFGNIIGSHHFFHGIQIDLRPVGYTEFTRRTACTKLNLFFRQAARHLFSLECTHTLDLFRSAMPRGYSYPPILSMRILILFHSA